MLKMNWKKAIIIALYFGIFQALMPFIGYLIGKNFSDAIMSIDHWIAFILLTSIGVNMILGSLKEEQNEDDSVNFRNMIVLAIATSIDALAVGFTLACLRVEIYTPIISIGIITFILSLIGVKIGNMFGEKYKGKSEILGGGILILIAFKILLEHI